MKIEKISTGSSNLVNVKKNREGPQYFSRLIKISVLDENRKLTDKIKMGTKFFIEIHFELFEHVRNLEIGFLFKNQYGVYLGGFVSNWEGFNTNFNKGKHAVLIEIPYMYFMPSKNIIQVWIKRKGDKVDDLVPEALEFEVSDYNVTGNDTYFTKYKEFGIFMRSNWRLINVEQ